LGLHWNGLLISMNKLILVEIRENIYKLAILFLVSVVITILGLFWFAQRKLIYSAVDIFKAYGLEDSVLVYYPSDDYATYDTLLSEVPGVMEFQKCEYHDIFNNLWDENNRESSDGEYYWFELYKLPELEFNPYVMVEGRVPCAANEIMIASNVKGIHVGDHICNYAVASKSQSNNCTYIKDIVVTGLFELNNPKPLEAFWTFQGVFQTFEENSIEIQQMTGSAFFYQLIDESGESIHELYREKIVIVRPQEGVTTDTLVRTIKSKTGIEKVFDYQRYKQYIENVHEDDLLLFRTLSVAVTVILLMMIISYSLISLFVGKQRLALYYAYGLTWKKAIRINMCINIIPIIMGYGLGLYLYVNKFEFIKDLSRYNYIFSLNSAMAVASLIIGLYLCINSAFYFYTRNKVPLSLLRRE